MNYYIIVAFLGCTIVCTRATAARKQAVENVFNSVEMDWKAEREPVEGMGYVARHPYLQGDLYSEIAKLDLTAKSGNRSNEEDRPSISIVESNTGRCVKNGGVVELEFQIPLENLHRDLTHSELVIELTDIDDAVSLLSSYILASAPPGKELPGEPVKGIPRLNNRWLVYDVSDILKAFDSADQRDGTVSVAVSVRIIGASTRNATESRVEFDACGKHTSKPPTIFLYHDFPSELRQSLRRSSGGGRRRNGRSVTTGQRTADQMSNCHLHQWTVDFHQIGLKWIIAPILFKINYCHGVCNDPAWTQADMRTRQQGRLSNHAQLIARALASLPPTASVGLPVSSCVPTGYEAMNMIYQDGNNVVRVDTFPQVIASSCGCA